MSKTIKTHLVHTRSFTHQDVFEGVTLKDVRAIFQKQPRNFALLLHKLVLVLEDAVNFPESSKYPVALTCVRLPTTSHTAPSNQVKRLAPHSLYLFPPSDSPVDAYDPCPVGGP